MSQTLLWDNCPSLPSLLEPNVRDNQLWLKGTDYEAQAELGAVMIAKPETEFITEWCVMCDTERCNASTPCSRRLHWENWSVTTELGVLSVTAKSPQSGWVREYQSSEQLWPQGRDTTGHILELMELENIVANTVYLKAREGGPEGSKGRRYVCLFVYLLSTVKTYYQVCVWNFVNL